ncbi:glutathione transferase [Massarina eburnea CBS 473.64]|uniref:glutathione transferase n=1 Tax=Massarina eburnea CBS 473.64 TaxID=1395130 RepID=A0A6A6S605_9PLEO|nr:glutathione transferase [Massarina eburnea CBS 473.64]
MSNQGDVKITVHWLNQSRGQRIVWLLEELGLTYEIKTYMRDKNMRAPASLKAVHPLGKSPCIEIEAPGLAKPLVLAESGPIVEYLYEHFGQKHVPKRYPEGKDGVVGAETEAWIQYRYLMHYAEGTFMPNLVLALFVGGIRSAPVPFFIKPITRKIADNIDASYLNAEIKLNLTFLEERLGKAPAGTFIVGDTVTGADIMLLIVLEGAIQKKSLTESAYPKLYKYVRHIQSLDTYKKAGDRVTEASGEKFVPFSEAGPA